MIEAFCLASGPSLTIDDVERVREWRFAAPDRIVGVANLTFRLAPWADYLWAMDKKWWRQYGKEAASFHGKKYSVARHGGQAEYLSRLTVDPYGNSGGGCISVARHLGAQRIYLLGYDCKLTYGKTHWHGDHPKGLGNAASMRIWPKQFERLASEFNAKGIDVINCSRHTNLTCFKRASLEDVLSA